MCILLFMGKNICINNDHTLAQYARQNLLIFKFIRKGEIAVWGKNLDTLKDDPLVKSCRRERREHRQEVFKVQCNAGNQVEELY